VCAYSNEYVKSSSLHSLNTLDLPRLTNLSGFRCQDQSLDTLGFLHNKSWVEVIFPEKKDENHRKKQIQSVEIKAIAKKKTSTFSIEKLSHPCIILGIYNTIYTSKKYHVNHLRNH